MGTTARHVDLRAATTSERVITELIKSHARICRDCQDTGQLANHACPEGWEMAKQLASVRAYIRRLSTAAAVVADTLF